MQYIRVFTWFTSELADRLLAWRNLSNLRINFAQSFRLWEVEGLRRLDVKRGVGSVSRHASSFPILLVIAHLASPNTSSELLFTSPRWYNIPISCFSYTALLTKKCRVCSIKWDRLCTKDMFILRGHRVTVNNTTEEKVLKSETRIITDGAVDLIHFHVVLPEFVTLLLFYCSFYVLSEENIFVRFLNWEFVVKTESRLNLYCIAGHLFF